MCRSTNRSSAVEPEVWFRVLHVGMDGHNGAPVATYCEQTVEIALGPRGAFENGSVGILKRRVTADRVVNVVAQTRRSAKPPRQPRTPRVVELLRKAQEWRQQIDAGVVRRQVDIARREGITRARVTQVMGLLRLTPEIQDLILCMPDSAHRPPITERALRPVLQLTDAVDQRALLARLIDGGSQQVDE